MKLSNVGGGKGSHFWHAFEGADEAVIGDEPENTTKSLDAPEDALRQGEDCPVVGLAAKPVGEPDAGKPHVRFDERGGETERLPIGSKPPRLSSTLPHRPGLLIPGSPLRGAPE